MFDNIFVRGISHAERRNPGVTDAVQSLSAGALFTLRREPENAYDNNAIQAMLGNLHAGYIAAESAAWIAPAMDEEPEVNWIGELVAVQPVGKTFYPILNVRPDAT